MNFFKNADMDPSPAPVTDPVQSHVEEVLNFFLYFMIFL